MDSSRSRRETWVLTQASFDRLLIRLDADRDRAGFVYERLRSKLTVFFQGRGCIHPEEYTDETINRVARLLEEGREVQDLSPAYFLGVAKNVLKEYWRKQRKAAEVEVPEDLPQAEQRADLVSDTLQVCVDTCLEQLSTDDREFILLYYQGEKREKIDTKKSLAARLGLNSPQIRKRAFKIRNTLRTCADRCCNESAEGGNVFGGNVITGYGGLLHP